MATTDHLIAERHQAEEKAIGYLWPHSNDLQWDEFTERGLRVFASGSGSTLTDVQGRTYIDGLAGLFLVNVGHGRQEIAAAHAGAVFPRTCNTSCRRSRCWRRS